MMKFNTAAVIAGRLPWPIGELWAQIYSKIWGKNIVFRLTQEGREYVEKYLLGDKAEEGRENEKTDQG